MNSLKELMRGLWGIHLLDENTQDYSTPTQLRKCIGLILVIVFGPTFILGPIFVLLVSIILILGGEWLYAIFALFVGTFVVGLNSIPCWIFIDWEKHRLKDKAAK